LIVESGFGDSVLDAGSEGVMIDGDLQEIGLSGRPSIQLVGSNDFGDGSPEICDGSPNDPPGGIPGFSPPLIDCTSPELTPGEVAACEATQPAVRDALEDIACRFSYVTSAGNSCTRNRFGDFAFLSPFATRQFCFQIPVDSRLSVGDTILAVQVRDVAGNLGPVREIVVRVPAEP